MKYLLLILLIYTLPQNCYTQTITGSTVPYEYGDVIYLYITNNETKTIIEYFKIESEKWIINPTKNLQNFDLIFKKIGFKEYIISFKDIGIDSVINVGIIQLEFDSAQYLQEVRVDAQKRIVKERKDTVFYKSSDFSIGNENNLEDLLKRLPGLQINSTGIISYNGQEISNLLINGKDIFKQQYTLGTRNINPNAVDEIQILKNYHEDDLLEEFQKGKLAINLKIKEKYLKLTGVVQLGAGINNHDNADYENKINLLNINPKNTFQELVSHNTIDGYYNKSDFFQKSTNLYQTTPYNTITNTLFLGNNYPSLITKNLQHHFNGSFEINSKTELKIVNLFQKHQINNQNRVYKRYQLDGFETAFEDEFDHQAEIDNFLLGIELNKKISADNLLKFKYYTSNDRQRIYSEQIANKQLATQQNNSFTSKSNFFSIEWTKKIKNSLVSNSTTLTYMQEKNGSYWGDFFYMYDTLKDVSYKLSQSPSIINNSTQFSFNKKEWQFTLLHSVKYLIENTKIDSVVHQSKQENKYSQYYQYLGIALNRKYKKFLFTTNFNTGLFQYNLIQNNDKNIRNNSFTYTLNQSIFWTTRPSYTILNFRTQIKPLIEEHHNDLKVLLGNRNINQLLYTDQLIQQNTISITNTLKSRNGLLYLDNKLVYTKKNQSISANNIFYPNSVITEFQILDKSNYSLYYLSNLSKYFEKIGTRIDLRYSITQMNSFIIYDDKEIENEMRRNQWGIYINTKIWNKSSLNTHFEWNHTSFFNEVSPRRNLKNLNSSLQLNFSNIERLSLIYNLSSIVILNQSIEQRPFFQNHFESTYLLKNKKLKIGMKILNIFNELYVDQISINEISWVQNRNYLLPRTILININYMFLKKRGLSIDNPLL